MNEFKRKDLLGIEDLSAEEIKLILETTSIFKEISTRPIKKVPTLRGQTVVSLFFEPSTRTRTSFDLAAKRLSADVVSVAASSSSVLKGETLGDTARNIEAMKVGAIIVRHSCVGTAHLLARLVKPAVINAGDGAHEHPTQALLDLFTVKEKKERINGLKVSIIGDIAHSRVARSDIWAFKKMGADVTVCGPETLMPPLVEKFGVRKTNVLDEAMENADVVIVLRMQLERQKMNLFPSLREYTMNFGIDKEKLKRAKKDVLIMHPGPINRGVELSTEVADGEYSVILDQVTNGIAVRMAVLYLLLGKEKEEE